MHPQIEGKRRSACTVPEDHGAGDILYPKPRLSQLTVLMIVMPSIRHSEIDLVMQASQSKTSSGTMICRPEFLTHDLGHPRQNHLTSSMLIMLTI